MGLDLSQGQSGDVSHQGLDAFVFANPLLDLREQILRNINRAGFALYLVGQVMGQVALTGLAVAAGTTAFFAEGDEAGGDERAVEFEFLDPRGQVAVNQGGVFWHFHRSRMIADYGAGITDTYQYVTDMATKKVLAVGGSSKGDFCASSKGDRFRVSIFRGFLASC